MHSSLYFFYSSEIFAEQEQVSDAYTPFRHVKSEKWKFQRATVARRKSKFWVDTSDNLIADGFS